MFETDDPNIADLDWDSYDSFLNIYGQTAGSANIIVSLLDGTEVGMPIPMESVSVSFDQNQVNVLGGNTAQVNATIFPADAPVTFQIPPVTAPATAIATLTATATNSFTITGGTPGNTTLQAVLNGNDIYSMPIIVPGADLPIANITSPLNDENFCCQRDDVSVTITASDPDGNNALRYLSGYVYGPQQVSLLAAAPYTSCTVVLGNYLAGSYSVSVEAKDYLGQMGTTEPVNFTIQTPPTITLDSPVDGQQFPLLPATVPLQATAIPGDGAIVSVDFFVDGQIAAIGIVNDDGITYTSTTTITANGNHVLTAVATDCNGWSTTSTANTITVVSRSPQVTLVTPTANQAFYPQGGDTGMSIPLSATATGLDGTISGITLGITYPVYTASVSSAFAPTTNSYSSSYAWTFPNVPISSQNYYAYAIAQDSNGAFSVDDLPGTGANFTVTPGVVITSPINDPNGNQQQFNPGSNINVNFQIFPSNIIVANLYIDNVKYYSLPDPGASSTIAYLNSVQGDHTMFIVATDQNGNSYYSATISIRVNQQPTCQTWVSSTIFKLPAGANVMTPITVLARANSANSSIQKVVFFKIIMIKIK